MKFCINCNKKIVSHDKRTKRCCKCIKLLQQGKSAPNFKHGKTLKKYNCIICRTKICVSTGIYGSQLCRSCSMKKLFKNSENHPQWLGGISKLPYAFEFSEELKIKIRKRDNYQCQNCTMTEEEHLIVYGKVLYIHHIDYNKKNCKKENLISLCMGCNIRANYNRTYWKNYYRNKMKENKKCSK